MGQKRIGIAVFGPNSGAVLDGIERAETLGIQAAWLTTGGAGPDGLTLLAAAIRTSTTMLGTAMTPTYPRHPVAMAQQVQVLCQLAPGRFRLGVGPSHRPTMQEIFGVDFRAPLGHLSEYIRILKDLLNGGAVDFQGSYYGAHAKIASPSGRGGRRYLLGLSRGLSPGRGGPRYEGGGGEGRSASPASHSPRSHLRSR